MDIDSLLQAWAEWCAARVNNGLGYSTTGLNRLIHSGIAGGSSFSSLVLYGEVDEVCFKIDKAVARLPMNHKRVIKTHYFIIGRVEDKLESMNMKKSTYYKFLEDGKALLEKELKEDFVFQ